MRFVSLLALCWFLLPQANQAQDNNPVPDKNFVPLKDIVNVVEQSLDVVKAELQKTDPQLTTAEFDFQTVSTKDTTGGIFASIVTLQVEHKKIATRETDFIYSVPDKQTALTRLQKRNSHFDLKLAENCEQDVVSFIACLWNRFNRTTDPEEIAKSLPGAIVAAAQAARELSRVKNPAGADDLTHRQFVITLTYQVQNSFNAGADPSSLISVGPQAKFSDETDRTQTLKLTFEDPKK